MLKSKYPGSILRSGGFEFQSKLACPRKDDLHHNTNGHGRGLLREAFDKVPVVEGCGCHMYWRFPLYFCHVGTLQETQGPYCMLATCSQPKKDDVWPCWVSVEELTMKMFWVIRYFVGRFIV